ncbi:MAG: ferrochelatase [Chlorobium sp.]|nr:MAG: ferrochelatase [Chlorobium sp.]
MVDGIVIRKRYAVIVTTYGEVEEVTVRNLWPSSRKILRSVTRQIVKIPEALIYFIADYRSTKHYIKWKRNRYHSSLLAINRAQTGMLRETIAASTSPMLATLEVTVTDAYYFVPPYLEEKLQQMWNHYDGIIILPMIPVESAFSCGVACQMVVDVFGESAFGKVKVLSKLWNDPLLHRIYTDYLLREVSECMRPPKKAKIGLVLVIHGTLVKDRAGNTPTLFTGLAETMAFFEVMKRMIMVDPENIFTDVRQGCMNHSRGGEWTSDTIEIALEGFKEEGYDGVVMFPYGFFADNSETEYDACKKLEEAGFPLWQYIRCINDTPEFGHWLSGKVLDGLQSLNNLQRALEPLDTES